MNYSQYIAALEASNPGLLSDDNKLTIGVSALKRLLLKTWNAGYENRKEVEASCEKLRTPAGSLDDLFGGLFGGKK